MFAVAKVWQFVAQVVVDKEVIRSWAKEVASQNTLTGIACSRHNWILVKGDHILEINKLGTEIYTDLLPQQS